ncbi:chloride conductance regulatory protein ICln [Momordica charantia]|uniref:Chloride conductance regulatory protein ICln n=1 Tax=Momordica charantia TaxID=3673 RepID=A0A6J1DZF8_MOMCH|nr:chloride conductance regulatory protein ICln [Momordica charantia]
MAMGLRTYPDRRRDGLPHFDVNQGEVLMHIVPAIALVFDNRLPEFPGTLYVSSRQLVWLSDAIQTKGFAIDFLSMSLHAVSKDPDAYPHPCLYVQIDTGADEESENSDSECRITSDTLDLAAVRELRLVPSNPDELETLFEICCQCAELNPEPTGDEEEGYNWFLKPEQLKRLKLEMAELEHFGEDPEEIFPTYPKNSIGQSNVDDDQLARTVLELQINDKRFEDAEEAEPGNDSNRR